MNIINRTNLKYISRKNFMLYTGMLVLGFLAMFKFPFKIFSIISNPKRHSKEEFEIKENPEAVKR